MKLEYYNWKKKHDLSKWSKMEQTVREIEKHEHEEFKRIGFYSGKACQVYVDADINIIANPQVLDFVGEDRVDAGYYQHDAVATPQNITILQNGWYKVGYGINSTQPQRIRVLQNGVPIQRSVTWDT